MPPSYDRLPAEAVVLRVLNAASASFFTNPDDKIPNPTAFRISDGDRAGALRRGREQAGFSVFDAARTSRSVAIAYRGLAPTQARVFALQVGHLQRIGQDQTPKRFIEVVRAEEDDKDGGAGHCLVEGFDEVNEKLRKKPEYKNMMLKILKGCKEVRGEEDWRDLTWHEQNEEATP